MEVREAFSSLHALLDVSAPVLLDDHLAALVNPDDPEISSDRHAAQNNNKVNEENDERGKMLRKNCHNLAPALIKKRVIASKDWTLRSNAHKQSKRLSDPDDFCMTSGIKLSEVIELSLERLNITAFSDSDGSTETNFFTAASRDRETNTDHMITSNNKSSGPSCPPPLAIVSNLRRLNLSHNWLGALAISTLQQQLLDVLPQLRELYLNSNFLRRGVVPDAPVRLSHPKLELLSLSHNRFGSNLDPASEKSDELGIILCCERLHTVNISENKLTSLGFLSAWRTPSLTSLDVSKNRLSSLGSLPNPSDRGSSGFARLKNLNVSNNRLTSLKGLQTLSGHLQKFNASSNELSESAHPSRVISHLQDPLRGVGSTLVELDLSSNKLPNLSFSPRVKDGGLYKLQRLVLAGNEIGLSGLRGNLEHLPSDSPERGAQLAQQIADLFPLLESLDLSLNHQSLFSSADDLIPLKKCKYLTELYFTVVCVGGRQDPINRKADEDMIVAVIAEELPQVDFLNGREIQRLSRKKTDVSSFVSSVGSTKHVDVKKISGTFTKLGASPSSVSTLSPAAVKHDRNQGQNQDTSIDDIDAELEKRVRERLQLQRFQRMVEEAKKGNIIVPTMCSQSSKQDGDVRAPASQCQTQIRDEDELLRSVLDDATMQALDGLGLSSARGGGERPGSAKGTDYSSRLSASLLARERDEHDRRKDEARRNLRDLANFRVDLAALSHFSNITLDRMRTRSDSLLLVKATQSANKEESNDDSSDRQALQDGKTEDGPTASNTHNTDLTPVDEDPQLHHDCRENALTSLLADGMMAAILRSHQEEKETCPQHTFNSFLSQAPLDLVKHGHSQQKWMSETSPRQADLPHENEIEERPPLCVKKSAKTSREPLKPPKLLTPSLAATALLPFTAADTEQRILVSRSDHTIGSASKLLTTRPPLNAAVQAAAAGLIDVGSHKKTFRRDSSSKPRNSILKKLPVGATASEIEA